MPGDLVRQKRNRQGIGVCRIVAAVIYSLTQASQVTRPNGLFQVQMASAIGIRFFDQMFRRGFKEPTSFDVGYWLPSKLFATFKELIGPTRIEVDCYFGLSLQPSTPIFIRG